MEDRGGTLGLPGLGLGQKEGEGDVPCGKIVDERRDVLPEKSAEAWLPWEGVRSVQPNLMLLWVQSS